ncbi:MAG: hypothetical protein EDM79_09680 [Chloroflexi bacterium]|nr:MAG: hypothetical protein EDM79_09680 [Chloroflexota bacterium]
MRMRFVRKSTPFLLAVLSLVLAVYQFSKTYSSGEWRNPSDEMVTKWEEHARALREALPSGVDQFGYADDSTVSGDQALFDLNEFFLMQYSLAPAALQIGVDQEWVIGNFNDNENIEAWLDETFGAHETQGFGFGLYLIHDLDE